MFKNRVITGALIIAVVFIFSLSGNAIAADKKKVLLIDSYHEGYAWSDGIVNGAKGVLADKVDLKVLRLDTKRNPSEDAKKEAALKAKQEIESWKPDVVIAADDNSAKYVIVPYFKDSNVPFVFCGINWDASIYGFPTKNVTGMVEVSLITPLMDAMGKFAKGQRVGFIGKDNETDQKEAEEITKRFKLQLNAKFVNTFDEWKSAFEKLQDEVDMLILINNAGITGWDDEAAKKFTREKTKVPTGSSHDFMAPFVLVDYAKLAEEQGEWAAGTAVQIMEGKSPKDIPVASNQKGQLYVNLPIADKLGGKFSLEVLKTAKVIKD